MKNPEKKITKKNLRTLTKNGGAHKLRNSTRIVKYGAINFARNIWLSAAASLIMTVTLLILFITVIASVILSETADVMRDKIDITIYFKPQTSVETLAELSKIMSADPNVKSVETSTSEKEYLRFIEENASNTELISTLDDPDMKEIMLSTMNSTMSVKVYDLDNLDSIRNLVAANELFIKNVDNEKEATYDENRSEISTITSWANIAKNGGIILGAVFLGLLSHLQHNPHGDFLPSRRNLHDEVSRRRPRFYQRPVSRRGAAFRYSFRHHRRDDWLFWLLFFGAEVNRLRNRRLDHHEHLRVEQISLSLSSYVRRRHVNRNYLREPCRP